MSRQTEATTWKPVPRAVEIEVENVMRRAQREAAAVVVSALLTCLEENYAIGWLGTATADDGLAARARRLRERIHDPAQPNSDSGSAPRETRP